MAKMVTVNLFDVDWTPQTAQKLTDTLDEFNLLPLDQRWRGEIRLEQILKIPAGLYPNLPAVYHLDFVKKREVGPGKLGNAAPVSGIQMNVDEDFGEETGCLAVCRSNMRWLPDNRSFNTPPNWEHPNRPTAARGWPHARGAQISSFSNSGMFVAGRSLCALVLLPAN